MKTLREVIEYEINRKNMTHTQVFTIMGISAQSYYSLLKRNSTKTVTLEKVAKALDTSTDYLFKLMSSEPNSDKKESNNNIIELTELSIKKALITKGVSAKQMCKDINLSEPTLYRFYESGKMNKTSERKIREYLELDDSSKVDTVLESNQDVSYWKSKYEESQQKIVHLLTTIQSLSLGKFRPVPFNPAYVFRR